MPLTAHLHWKLDGHALDARVLALLDGIARCGSLNRAIGEAGISYRHAWGLLGRLENALGQPLVVLERGRGARLTPLGEQLAKVTTTFETQLQPGLRRAASELNRALHKPSARREQRFTVCASHDLALAELREVLEKNHVCVMDLHFQGSLDALMALHRNQCDIAGFHVADVPGLPRLDEPFRPWLKARTLRLVPFAIRRQGLMVPAGNPLRIRTLRDLARTRVHFINRQPGSGTRLLLDRLLAAERLRPAQIAGYQHEEFTHAAVAATVASGMANAAFGIEAAARQQGLDFVPVATEHYFLATREAT
ncbi:MAG TPA: substrate-binding domain-containing protein, partial [Burkholderiales bacterium]|nr:substrate-binding domain-containing protein [Burkholderiales bacterium]